MKCCSNDEPIPLPAWLVLSYMDEILSIFHGCMMWIEKSVMRITERHHEACLVMPISDPE